MPVQTAVPWLVDRADRGKPQFLQRLLVFAFIARLGCSPLWLAIHRFASTALRRDRPGTAASPIPIRPRSTPPSSFAQPIRRVFGTLVFSARGRRWTCRARGHCGPARLHVASHDLDLGDALRPDRRGVVRLPARTLNHLQFLTIRRYLSLVFFGPWSLLLLVVALWQ
jgi:hydrogenase-4 component B